MVVPETRRDGVTGAAALAGAVPIEPTADAELEVMILIGLADGMARRANGRFEGHRFRHVAYIAVFFEVGRPERRGGFCR